MTTFLKISDIKTSIINNKDNVGGANDTQIIEWCEFINQSLYPKLVNINPNDYLTNSVFKTIADTANYTLPTNFQNIRVGGVYETQTGTDFGALNYDAETVAFSTIGQTITGGTSGATGTLSVVKSSTLILTSVLGTFEDNEVITGSTEGSATVNGTLIAYKYSNVNLVETGFGSQKTGYWLDDSLNFTPTPDQSKVFVLRYITSLTTLSLLTDDTIIPARYREFARDAADIYWNQWRDDSASEAESGQRAAQALTHLLGTFAKTPSVFSLPNRTNIYR